MSVSFKHKVYFQYFSVTILDLIFKDSLFKLLLRHFNLTIAVAQLKHC